MINTTRHPEHTTRHSEHITRHPGLDPGPIFQHGTKPRAKMDSGIRRNDGGS